MWNKVSSESMRKTWWHVSGKELDADERKPEVDRKKGCWWKRTGWWMSYHLRQVWTEWSSCWAIPFFLRIRRCLFLSKLEQSHFYVFVCFLSTLSLHWAVPQISFVFDFIFCGLCSWLLQIPLLVFFCQRDIQSFFCHQAIPSYLSSLYLWKLRSALEYLQYR